MLTRRLAEFVVDIPADDIPQDVLEGARHALIDTIGCALAGIGEQCVEIATDCVTAMQARPSVAVWGRHFSTTAAEAAFVNGMASHVLDFDDSLPTQGGHPGVVLAPTVMAAGEASGASGREVLIALALGLEVAGKLGRIVGADHYLAGWHPTATVGIFAATAAAARLWKLDAGQLSNAWGLAASQAAGLRRNFGTMTKPFHAGNAARGGVSAAWMARHGFTGDAAIFEGRDGFLATYAGKKAEPMAEVLKQLADPWEMLKPGLYVKRWPCCYCSHRPISGIIELASRHGIRPEEVEHVEVSFLPGADNSLVNSTPRTGLEAKFSLEYLAAAALFDGGISLGSFTDAMVMRPPLRMLMSKVSRRIEAVPGDGAIYSSTTGHCGIEIKTRRGAFHTRIDHPPGSPALPMTERDRLEKFVDCANPALGAEGTARLLKLLQTIAAAPNLDAIAAATRPSSGASAHRVTA